MVERFRRDDAVASFKVLAAGTGQESFLSFSSFRSFAVPLGSPLCLMHRLSGRARARSSEQFGRHGVPSRPNHPFPILRVGLFCLHF